MFRKIGISILFLVAVGFWVCITLSSRLLSSQIRASLQKECPKCTLHFKKLKVSWFPFQVVASGIEFKGDPTSNPVVNISADYIEARLQVRSLFQDAPTIEALTGTGLSVTVQERVLNTPGSGPNYPPPGYAFKSFPPVRVNRILIKHSQLTYQHLIHAKVAQISVQDINCEAGAFVTRDWLLREGYRIPAKLRATARLEGSGRAELQISFDPFAQKNCDEIVIKLKDQKMSTLNPFFEAEDGIQLSGVLNDGVAVMTLREGHLSGTLTATYRNLEFKFNSTPDRGAIKSFIATILQSATTSKTRPRQGEKSLPQASISTDRLIREPITKLLIRGLREAAKKVLAG